MQIKNTKKDKKIVRVLLFMRHVICLGMVMPVLIFMGTGCGGDDGGKSSTSSTKAYTLSGTITAAANVTVDSDVNDTNEVYIANDTIAQAQEIPNPVTLGGFVNMALAGEAGRSYTLGDPDDYFRVDLEAGDEVTLVVAAYDTAEVALSLYSDADHETPVETVLVEGSFALVTAADAGTYIIHVQITAGATNYTLSVGTITGSSVNSANTVNGQSGSSDLRLSADFLPNQVIIKFRDESAVRTSDAAGIRNRLKPMGLAMTTEGTKRSALMKFDENQKQAMARTMGLAPSLLSASASDPLTNHKIDTLRMIRALRKQPDVLYAEPNYIVRISEIPDDDYYPIQWNLSMINLEEAWDITTGSSDVIVAVVDTGILMNHPDLQGQLTDTGYDFIGDEDTSLDGDGLDSDPSDPGDEYYGTYSSFHGTHCAGIAAAASDNSIGIAGVAWSTKIMPIRVLGYKGEGSSYDVLQGVLYAAGLENDAGIILPEADRADIISLSLGADGSSAYARDVYQQVRAQGIVVVAAAGNDSEDVCDYPAAYDDVIAVSAVNSTGELAWYSNYGNKIDVAAPGGAGSGYADGVMSTCGDDSGQSLAYTYSTKNGTSMATPHVAGVVALMKAMNPDLTPDDLDYHIQHLNIVTDAGPTGWDEEFGYGIIDAHKAVQVAQTGVAGVLLKVSPEAFNFGYSASSVTLTAEKSGDDTLPFNVDTVVSSAPWLTVVSDTVDSEGLGTYTAQADRTGLADGFYSTIITFTTTIDGETGNTLVRAYMQVNASGGVIPDSGYHYVLLVDADTLERVKVDEVSAENGQYTYTFNRVTKNGHYKIFAGTDRDFNRIINNYGESFGAYGSVDQPLEIIVTEDMTGLDFSTELNVSFTAESQTVGGETVELYLNP